jgi:hypothetical protein
MRWIEVRKEMVMTIDLYTKAVLTVIAACLAWISIGGPSLITSVQAQPEGQRVIIAGWEWRGRNISTMPLPLPVHDYGPASGNLPIR